MLGAPGHDANTREHLLSNLQHPLAVHHLALALQVVRQVAGLLRRVPVHVAHSRVQVPVQLPHQHHPDSGGSPGLPHTVLRSTDLATAVSLFVFLLLLNTWVTSECPPPSSPILVLHLAGCGGRTHSGPS